MTENKTYRVENLSCANCAKTYEANLKNLPRVEDAKVNFGASKIYITGDASIEEMEKAGAFDRIKVRDVKEKPIAKTSFWKNKENYPVYIAAVLILFTLITSTWYPSVAIYGYIAAIIIGGYDLFMTGLKNLVKLKFDMNTLMTIAVIGAALIGEWQEAAAVVVLFAISEALERYSMDKARASIGMLMDIAPAEALIRRSNEEHLVSVDDIQIGDVMLVQPGSKVAMDGIVIKGDTAINQAAITGESIPVTKQINDEVFAGTLNEEGYIEVKVTKLADDTTIAKIIHLVEEAQAEKAQAQAFVDRFARYYTPVIILISLLVMLIPPLLLGQPWHQWLYQGLAVLIIGCPCALIISTPVAIVTAIGHAARNGVLIKGGIHLEEVGHIETLAFDKTGTLTNGQPAVTDVQRFNEDAIIKTAALERLSKHPIASAFTRYAGDSDIEVSDFRSLTGQGVRGLIHNQIYFAGSPALFISMGHTIPAEVVQWQQEGKTVILAGTEKQIELIAAVADELRPEAKQVLSELSNMQLNTLMLTGDNQATAEAIARQAGVSHVVAELMPDDKLDKIRRLEQTGKVAMIGDGVNDAPALAAADVGIAMSGSTDTAMETADIVLMSNDLTKLPYTIRLSRQTLKIIKQNITFSLVIKLIALLLVIPGWLTLWIAIFSDIGATLIVTLNSMRLMKTKTNRG